MVFFSGGGALRDASGDIADLLIANGTMLNYTGVQTCINGTCRFGLHNSYSVSNKFYCSLSSFIFFSLVRSGNFPIPDHVTLSFHYYCESTVDVSPTGL